MEEFKEAVRRTVIAEEELASAEREISRLQEEFRSNHTALQALLQQSSGGGGGGCCWRAVSEELFEQCATSDDAIRAISAAQDAIRAALVVERTRAESARLALHLLSVE